MMNLPRVVEKNLRVFLDSQDVYGELDEVILQYHKESSQELAELQEIQVAKDNPDTLVYRCGVHVFVIKP